MRAGARIVRSHKKQHASSDGSHSNWLLSHPRRFFKRVCLVIPSAGLVCNEVAQTNAQIADGPPPLHDVVSFSRQPHDFPHCPRPRRQRRELGTELLTLGVVHAHHVGTCVAQDGLNRFVPHALAGSVCTFALTTRLRKRLSAPALTRRRSQADDRQQPKVWGTRMWEVLGYGLFAVSMVRLPSLRHQ